MSLRSSSPLVGRDHELAILRNHLRAALAGRGSLVLISGEAGVGKTALADLLCGEGADAGAEILVGHCYDRMETPSYGPWLEIVQHFRSFPLLADAPPLPRLKTAASQADLFVQAREFLAAVTRHTPLLILLEDLHWADTASFDLLRFLAREIASLPILLIVTYRGEELYRIHPFTAIVPLLVREAQAERLALRPLDMAETVTLVQGRYRLPNAEAARLASYLIERTEGNALFMIELLRMIEEEGVLQHVGGKWQVKLVTRTLVPRLLKQVIDARITRLGDEADGLLAIAAVIGHAVPLSVWQAVAQANEETLLTVTEHAQAAHLLTASASGGDIRFNHALIRDALYENTPPIRRRRLHRQVGEVLSTLPAPDPDAVAYHFQQAKDDRAATWLTRAGERAEDAYALVSAAERYEAAITLRDAQRGDARERGWLRLLVASLRRYQEPERAFILVEEAMQLASGAGDASLAARTQAMHGLLVGHRGEHRTAMAILRAALDTIERLPPGAGTTLRRERHIDTLVNRGSLINNLAHFGYFAEARMEAERHLTRLAEVTSAPVPAEAAALADIHGALSLSYAMQGEPLLSRQSYAACIEAHRANGNYLAMLPKRREELVLAVLPYQADNLPERNRVIEDAERIALRLIDTGALPDANGTWHVRLPLLMLEGHWREARRVVEQPDTSYLETLLHFGTFTRGTLARAQGDPEGAWRCVREALLVGATSEPGERYVAFTIPLQLLAASLALDTGDLATARRWLDAHRRWLDFMDAVLGRSEGEGLEAAWHRAAGDAAQAYAHAERALAHATTPHQPLALLAAHRILGVLAGDAAHFAEAERHFAASLTLADACCAPYERALTLIARAELSVARHEDAYAQTLLDEARELCLPMDARLALRQIESLAARLTGRLPGIPADLSIREVEVLRHLAAGLTNTQIADRLTLSPHTVKAHVANVYAKIGVSNRAAAKQFAADHRLS